MERDILQNKNSLIRKIVYITKDKIEMPGTHIGGLKAVDDYEANLLRQLGDSA